MTRGFSDSGRFRPHFAVESDPYAAATYAANFGSEHVYCRPIQQVLVPHADVVVGGPPCQGFSQLNRGRHGVESRRFWREYVRALDEAEPYAFVMENVPQLLSSPEYVTFKAEVLARGYHVREGILNVADFGVPQRRKRAIVVGSAIGPAPWPETTHAEFPDERGLQPWVTFREAVAGLPPSPDGRNWHRSRYPRPETVRRYEAVPPNGGNRFEMEANLDRVGLGHLVPPCWRKHRRGSCDVFGRLWWDRPATTIRTEFYKPEKGRYLHPFEHRAITVREAARLMSFPDDFVLPDNQSMTAIGRQIGNAVPPLLARRLADAISTSLDLGLPSRTSLDRAA